MRPRHSADAEAFGQSDTGTLPLSSPNRNIPFAHKGGKLRLLFRKDVEVARIQPLAKAIARLSNWGYAAFQACLTGCGGERQEKEVGLVVAFGTHCHRLSRCRGGDLSRVLAPQLELAGSLPELLLSGLPGLRYQASL